jgi:hypothetical protein
VSEVVGEIMDGSRDCEKIRLSISDELRLLLEERRVLDSDIRQVIDIAEQNGTKFLNRETGHLLAHHQLLNVTYWVEYTFAGGVFTIYNAYSHRMVIM